MSEKDKLKKNLDTCPCFKIKALEGGDKDVARILTQFLCSCRKIKRPEMDE